jgi:hypothetical protein|tara:strand:+ start:728 stop:901 length:174 start_codon:yes stop_codon:yes gene_type:complete
MTKINLLFIAILGSALAFRIIDLFIIEVSVMEFIIIEIIISCVHTMYNIAKKQELNP